MSPSGLNSPASPQASPSTLAGTGQQPPDSGQPAAGGGGDDSASSSNDALKQSIQKLRSAEMEMMEMAARFPAAASSLRQATTSIRAALRAIIANPGQPEPKAPNIGG